MNAGGQRAGTHHVDGAREPVLGQHLTAGMEEQRQLGPRVVDESLERSLDPRLDHGHLHQATSPPAASSSPTARSSSTRTSPTLTAGDRKSTRLNSSHLGISYAV